MAVRGNVRLHPPKRGTGDISIALCQPAVAPNIGISEARMLRLSRSVGRLGMAVLALLVLARCVTLSSEESFNHVADAAQARLGKHISWDAGQYEDPLVRSTIGKLLSRPLTPETAVQVALLNNRELQSTYADLGIAQANVVQAALWKNPIVTGVVFFPITGGGIDYTFDFALRVIDIVYIPLRKRVAEAELRKPSLKSRPG
jgi:cobalt-zinc-cadmium efflux system outer membrane protein